MVAFAHAILSITNVTVIKLTNAKNIKRKVLNNQPAPANAAGSVNAPVPTIKLKIYTNPT